MSFRLTVEAAERTGEKRQLPCARKAEYPFPVLPLPEGDAEVPGVERRGCIDAIGEMADNLVSEEVQGDAVGVAPGESATEAFDIKLLSVVEVPSWDRQVKHIQGGAHHNAASKVSDRRPRRSVSSAITSSARMLPKLTEDPIRRRK